MPKAMAIDSDLTATHVARPRSGSGKRHWMLCLALRSPKDTAAGAVALAGVAAVLINALWLQAGRHPSPMFGATTLAMPDAGPAPVVSPRPRPAEIAVARPADAERGATPTPTPQPRPAAAAAAGAASGPRNDPLGNLIVVSQRVASVQRALTDYGYGQLKPTGTIGSDTQAAIQKFERERKLPITGQVSDRLMRELGLVTGRPLN